MKEGSPLDNPSFSALVTTLAHDQPATSKVLSQDLDLALLAVASVEKERAGVAVKAASREAPT